MKLVRYGEPGREHPGLLDGAGALRDLSGVVDDIAGDVLTARGLASLRAVDASGLPAVAKPYRLGAPVGRVGKLVCVGLNYADHAAEAGQPIPKQPVLFMKATSAIVGPFDDVVIPRGSVKTDMTLAPGDVISTGTPPGVGLGQKPPVYLKAGDVMELGVEGLGQQRQKVVAAG